jgi:hypothetical protein
MTYSGPVSNGEPPRRTVYRQTVKTVKAGASFGSALAIVISWSVHKSILWAMLQGMFGWVYVIYYALTR